MFCGDKLMTQCENTVVLDAQAYAAEHGYCACASCRGQYMVAAGDYRMPGVFVWIGWPPSRTGCECDECQRRLRELEAAVPWDEISARCECDECADTEEDT